MKTNKLKQFTIFGLFLFLLISVPMQSTGATTYNVTIDINKLRVADDLDAGLLGKGELYVEYTASHVSTVQTQDMVDREGNWFGTVTQDTVTWSNVPYGTSLYITVYDEDWNRNQIVFRGRIIVQSKGNTNFAGLGATNWGYVSGTSLGIFGSYNTYTTSYHIISASHVRSYTGNLYIDFYSGVNFQIIVS